MCLFSIFAKWERERTVFARFLFKQKCFICVLMKDGIDADGIDAEKKKRKTENEAILIMCTIAEFIAIRS